MTNEEIVKALRCLRVETGSLSCLGCGYEHSCNVHGCQIPARMVPPDYHGKEI